MVIVDAMVYDVIWKDQGPNEIFSGADILYDMEFCQEHMRKPIGRHQDDF